MNPLFRVFESPPSLITWVDSNLRYCCRKRAKKMSETPSTPCKVMLCSNTSEDRTIESTCLVVNNLVWRIVLSVWKTDNEEKEDGVGHFEKTKWFNQWENQRTWHIITGFLFTVTYEKLECITMQQLEISTWKYVQETYKIWQLDLYPPHRNINLLTFQRSQPFRCLSKDKDGSTTIKSALKRALTKKCRLWFKELQSLFLFGKLV